MSKLTAKKVKEIRAYYAAGESTSAIAVWYDVHPNTVCLHTKDIRRVRHNAIDKAELVRMLDAGVKKVRIARHFGVTERAVSWAIQRMRGDSHVKRKAPTKISPDLAATIQREWLAGMSKRAIARRHGLGHSTVYRRLQGLENMRAAA